jgi:hypothetical protein
VAESGELPQLLGLVSRLVELTGVLHREEQVPVAVDDEQRDGRDQRCGLRWRHRNRIPPAGADPGLHEPSCHEPAGPVLHRQVDLAHPLRSPVVPAAGAAHRYRGVQAADEAGVPQHDGSAHREPDRRDPLIAELPRVGDHYVEVLELAVPQRGKPAGPPVAAEVEAHDPGDPVEPGGNAPDRGPLPGQGEPVRDDDRQLGRSREMHGVDRDTVLGDQRPCREYRSHRAPILKRTYRKRCRW